jgi:hypothetical protein
LKLHRPEILSGMKRVAHVDHIQIAAPDGCEPAAREFYGSILGLQEVEKPLALHARGCCSSVTNSRCISESNRVFTPPRRHILHLLCSALMSYDKLLSPAASALLMVKIYPTDVVSSLTTRGVTGSNLSKCSGSSLVVLSRFRLRSNEPLSRSL